MKSKDLAQGLKNTFDCESNVQVFDRICNLKPIGVNIVIFNGKIMLNFIGSNLSNADLIEIADSCIAAANSISTMITDAESET